MRNEMSSQRILCIDDEESIRITFTSFLSGEGYVVDSAATADEALDKIGRGSYDLIFLDILLKNQSGINVLRVIRKQPISPPVIMVTGAPEVETAAEAVRLGAFDYIAKPVRQETLLRLAKLALQHQELVTQKNRYQSHLEAIFRSVHDGILTVDEDLKLLELNQAAKNILNISSEALGLSLAQVTGPKSLPTTIIKQTLITQQPAEIYRSEYLSAIQGRKILTLNTSPLLSAQGVFSGVVLIIRDETRLVDLERNLEERIRPYNMIGNSAPMRRIYQLIHSLASVDTTVLISGESGTGKELVAEALHFLSERKDHPLVKFNCAALPENLLESELFGHLRGAFTGAHFNKAGRFQTADGGTIFLDEIGDISPATQVRLLRVLQNKVIEPVGGTTPIKVDVRIVTATNSNLLEKVKQGTFREDLYFRLNVINIKLPPLRDRHGDIPLLIHHFIDRFNLRFRKNIRGVSDDVIARFKSYSWPGNIRELEHAMEHAFVLCQGELITTEHLAQELLDSPQIDFAINPVLSSEEERDALIAALNQAGGNKTLAAKLLGMSRRTIYRKLEEYKL
jgi:two-component system, NtrC family, response regulator HydG